MNLESVTVDLVQLVKRVCRVIVERLNCRVVTEKDGAANLVTDIDLLAQSLLIEGCRGLIPTAGFIAEEGLEWDESDWLWVIDPIDGTCNYTYDYRHSCISVALYHHLEGVLGIVYNPFSDECFVGLKGYGAYLNGSRIYGCIHDLAHALVMVGTCPYQKDKADLTFEVMKRIFLHARDIRRSGSAALDLCYVACGRADAFYEASLSPWDYAAGVVILKEAGVCVELMADGVSSLIRCGVIAGNRECFADFKRLVFEGE